MKIYLVGGAVRDKLLHLAINERDWVVVGGTVDAMLKLGYRQVGKEFPVFLHPETQEEYALARMERKVSKGYTGFAFDTSPTVTLEEDLERRDLTINAMAETAEGHLIDPYHGKRDLEQKILRHVSPAFSEDPVRILRTGRFLARYAYLGFHIAPETVELMRQMVHAGEVDALVAERVWKELERALGEKNPEQFFITLANCDALPILFPALAKTPPLSKNPGLLALKIASKLTADTLVRFAVLFHAVSDEPKIAKKIIDQLADRYRLPNAYRALALITALHSADAFHASTFTAEKLLHFFTVLDIFRREERFQQFLLACNIIAEAKKKAFDATWLTAAAAVAKSVAVKPFLEQGLTGNDLSIALREARQLALNAWITPLS